MKCSDCGKGVLPAVAVDIDGVLGKYHKQFFTFAAVWLDKLKDLEYWLTYDGSVPMNEWMGIPKSLYRTIKLAYRQGGTKRWMEPFKEAAGFLHLVHIIPVELWITTTRPYQRLDNVDPDTQEWLRRNNIHHDGLIYDEDKYDRLVDIVGADRIVAVLDDEGVQYDNAERLGLSPILRSTSFNRAIRRPSMAVGLAQAYSMIESLVTKWKEQHDDPK